MKPHQYLHAFLILACLLFAHGCALDQGVTKSNAATGLAIGIMFSLATYGTGLLAFGWSAISGFGAGLFAFFFGKSPPPPGAVSGPSIPWFWIALVCLIYFNGHHLLDALTRSDKLRSFGKALGFVRDRAPKKPSTRADVLRRMETA